MKKLLCIIFVFLVLFSLCACGSTDTLEQTESKSSGSGSVGTASAEADSSKQGSTDFAYDLAIPVSIPATFTLYLDENMNIVSVKADDEADADFASQLDIIGMSYSEGMKIFLNTSMEQDYLSDLGEVVFSIPCEALSTQLMRDLCAPVDQLWLDGNAHLTIDWSIIPEEAPELSSPDFFGIQETESNGQTIYIDKMSMAHPADGSLYTQYGFYSKYPNPMLYTDGTLLGSSIDAIRFKLLSFNENGNWGANYLQNGKLVRYVGYANNEITATEYVSTGANLYFSKQLDGSYLFFEAIDNIVEKTHAMSSEGWYGFSEYENGIVVASYSQLPDGTVSSTTYNSNGVMMDSYSQSPDGTVSSSTYDVNGTMISSYYESPDGTVSSSTYDANGTIINSYNESSDGTVSDVEYDSNGMIVSSYYQAQDGYITRQTYYPGGNISVSEEWSNGAHTVCTYAEDSSLLNYVQEPWDGTIPDNG